MTSDAMFSLLCQILAASGGGALMILGLFQFFGKGWIENQLARNLEAAKVELSLLAARQMKLHDREYIVFPEVWTKLNKAYNSLGAAIVGFREMPDLKLMSESELQTWVARSDLSGDERIYLSNQPDKTKAYSDILDNRSVLEANRDFIDFHTYLQANRIFLSPEIKRKFDKIGDLIRSSWAAKKMDRDGHALPNGKSFLILAFEKYETEAKPIMTEIETLFEERIFPSSTAKQKGRAA